MPRRANCARCGTAIQLGGGSLPPGQATCRSCRTVKSKPFDASKCGTPRGRDQHRRRGEEVCDPCRLAWNDATRSRLAEARARGYVRPGRDAPKVRRLLGQCSDCGVAIKASAAAPLCVKCRARSKRGIYINDADRVAIYNRDNWTCGICSESVDPTLSGHDQWGPTLDHIIPRSLGGSDDAENLRLAHRACNSARGNRVA